MASDREVCLTPQVGPRDRDTQDHGRGIIGQLFGLLLDASEDAMDQNHPAVCFIDAFLIGQQAAQRKPLTFGGSRPWR